ncbi:hypothetical protein PN465_17820 [Nodularia spumigena CS-584]|jgi:hypothetical protein|uniref:Uncharacterized protein n=1 Tax=Nodularia spumigena UHCC 0060 TaxID=3110300 RepID=A0ABU5UX57_NODSP|nr:hypothetical protein [Nodularia spumigena]AHJ29870.1 hypothetical protein NSP_35470 [Nodularia spumigena CCY9414]MDB9304879.1 hypothetical protein [Nodularia spumigena CS-591/12]MDB9346224.1 hypothetical protein [Nodularia spumigena CS-588/01]MDB9351027.1 hypothetical protein [Nodularia spumigena CS-588/05]MDB9384057.1 hypothetical protein [Nodularia spumigena CS-584]
MIKPISAHQRPWTIVRFLENSKTHTVAHFANRQDADDHLRVLHRVMPNAEFKIVFEPPQEPKNCN